MTIWIHGQPIVVTTEIQLLAVCWKARRAA